MASNTFTPKPGTTYINDIKKTPFGSQAVVGQQVSSPSVRVGTVINKNTGAQVGQSTPGQLGNVAPSGGGQSSGGGGGQQSSGGGGSSLEDAAAAAAEARRQAAARKYDAQVNIANVAKGSAKGQYDWLVDTLGSNKKDLLDQVALNEQTGVQQYSDQTNKTQTGYDDAKKNILTTYRDLGTQQEKILRGAGVGQSSRSTEAQLRLNNLLGKDMSEVSKNEADALALIGNALNAFKEKIVLTKNSIETQTKSQIDKASLDYDNIIKSIDANLQLSANEREDAYAAAEVQLQQDTFNIKQWAAGAQSTANQTIASNKNALDDFIVQMTSNDKLLNGDLASKQTATNDLLSSISGTQLDQETAGVPKPGVYKASRAKSLADVYNQDNGVASGGVSAEQDPLLGALFA